MNLPNQLGTKLIKSWDNEIWVPRGCVWNQTMFYLAERNIWVK